MMGIRLYVCGRLAIAGNLIVDEAALPGRQVRLALAMLAVERRHPVSVDQLTWALWGDDVPAGASASVASVVSKVRRALRRAGADGPEVIAGGVGTYHLRLPAGSTIDLESARQSIDVADGARRQGNHHKAWAEATVAVSIARRGFLPGEAAPWAYSIQQELQRIEGRGYRALTWAWSERGNGAMATAMAERAVEVEPLHEPSWRALMRTRARFASRADAVRAYRRCREVIGSELGVAPDAMTTRLYEELLTS
ncbi:MAG: BTAD domain-containing putative transcriptional regulator [Desertimonas sp.]